MKKHIAKISLVGAGPGDPELITLKALKAIQQADVILYDALVNEAILEEASPNCIKIFVGKRAGKHSYKQDEINLLMVQNAYLHGHVVRLKGGDAFVFGRGHEELEFARAFNIETALIPGISSSIAVPELQEVPLTRRGINDSFWVMTATKSSGKLSGDIQLAAQSSATLVILMGIRKLPQIVNIFKELKKEKTPVMIVQNGSRSNEQFVVGTIEDIVAKANAANIGTPGIIVIGEVVKLHPSLNYELVGDKLIEQGNAEIVKRGISNSLKSNKK